MNLQQASTTSEGIVNDVEQVKGNTRSVLFVDEIHRLNKVTEEILYSAMEDYCLDRTIGKGHATKIVKIPLPKVHPYWSDD